MSLLSSVDKKRRAYSFNRARLFFFKVVRVLEVIKVPKVLKNVVFLYFFRH